MKNFLVVARSFGPNHEKYINLVKNYIEENGGKCVVDANPYPDEAETRLKVPKDTDCILTVGGDGTVVRVAQNSDNTEVPIVGLNCGHLGYLCDMTIDNWQYLLDHLLKEECSVDKRMMLEGKLGSTNRTFKALNDIVVSSNSAGIAVLNLTVSVNGIVLYNHNCDGLILATPTGSTAYNLSANGPIVSPHSDCIILTPINPHTLNSRSIILASTDVIEIKVCNRREGLEESAAVIFDGTSREILRPNDSLSVYKSNDTTKMVRLETANFLERIRARMQEI